MIGKHLGLVRKDKLNPIEKTDLKFPDWFNNQLWIECCLLPRSLEWFAQLNFDLENILAISIISPLGLSLLIMPYFLLKALMWLFTWWGTGSGPSTGCLYYFTLNHHTLIYLIHPKFSFSSFQPNLHKLSIKLDNFPMCFWWSQCLAFCFTNEHLFVELIMVKK